ncbi:MAG: abortive infection system antitoxin AbiGi family protein [Candidatus Sumerlaeia bacterium]
MTIPEDDGYISNYLTHWTGKFSDEDGVKNLNSIIAGRRLLLSENVIHTIDYLHLVKGRMVCFTDVPFRFSSHHCGKYGRFGIVFKKNNLIHIGAQPVFYSSHIYKRDMNKVFNFIKEQTENLTIPEDVYRSICRHFYFMQAFSDGQTDSPEAFYYEREWRLGEQTLLTKEAQAEPNPPYRLLIERGLPYPPGLLVEDGDKVYFGFNESDVAYLIAPKKWISEINHNGFMIEAYEDICAGKPVRV